MPENELLDLLRKELRLYRAAKLPKVKSMYKSNIDLFLKGIVRNNNIFVVYYDGGKVITDTVKISFNKNTFFKNNEVYQLEISYNKIKTDITIPALLTLIRKGSYNGESFILYTKKYNENDDNKMKIIRSFKNILSDRSSQLKMTSYLKSNMDKLSKVFPFEPSKNSLDAFIK